MWVDTADLPTSDGHPFFERLNRVLEEAGFDAFVEGLCAAFYAARMGRPSLRPGRYFRLLVIGYFDVGMSAESVGEFWFGQVAKCVDTKRPPVPRRCRNHTPVCDHSGLIR